MLLCRFIGQVALYAAHVDIWQPGFNMVQAPPLVVNCSTPSNYKEAIRQICNPSSIRLLVQTLAATASYDSPDKEEQVPSTASNAAPGSADHSTEQPFCTTSPWSSFTIPTIQKYSPSIAKQAQSPLEKLWQAPITLVILSTLQQVLELGACINIHPEFSAGRELLVQDPF